MKIIYCLLMMCASSIILTAQAPEILVVSDIDLNDQSVIDHLVTIAEENRVDDHVLVILGASIATAEPSYLRSEISRLVTSFTDVYLLPSGDSWDRLGAEGIKELDDYISDTFDKDIFVPDNACGETEIKEYDGTALVFIDSEWYMQNWDKDNYINRECRVKDRSRFWIELSDEINNYRDVSVLLFSIHGPHRYDRAGGYYPTFSQLFIPPVSFYANQIKSQTTNFSSPTHPIYRDYCSRLTSVVEIEPNVLTISSDAKYQMQLKDDDGHFINVNTSGQKNYFRGNRFSWADETPSYLIVRPEAKSIDYSWNSWSNDELLHYDEYVLSDEISDETPTWAYDNADTRLDSFTTSVLSGKNLGKYNNAVLGNLNTSLYYDSVTVPVLDLNIDERQLRTARMGGGNQTISLRLQDSLTEETYVARAIQKTPERLVPPPFDIALFEKLVFYYFTGAHPYGFLASNSLEKELGLLRTEPKLMYLPKQKRLEPYNDEIGDRLVLYRQRLDGDMSDNREVAYSTEVISTSDFLEEYYDQDAKADARMYLKARILDLLLNDWDRHRDQWRWALSRKSEDGLDIYRPIPRDRDQALSNYDGLVTTLIRYYNPPMFPAYPLADKPSRKSVEWMHQTVAYLDRIILTELDKAAWDEVTQEVIATLGPDEITTAIAKMPIYNTRNLDIRQIMISRLESIEQMSNDLYEVINDRACVVGTSKDDIMIIESDKDGLSVKIMDDDQDKVMIERRFTADETKRLWVNLYDGDDDVRIRGEKSPISITMVGGYGEDKFTNETGTKSALKIYELNDENTYEGASKVKEIEQKEIISLTRSDFKSNYSFIIPVLGFNRDDGVIIGASYNHLRHSYKKTVTHSLGASIATARRSTEFSYSALIESPLYKLNKYIDLQFLGPRYENNFFGVGNETSINTSIDREFYFLRQRVTQLNAGWLKDFDGPASLRMGFQVQESALEDVGGRFISEQDNINRDVFESQYFAGGHLQYLLQNFDNNFMPNKGLEISLRVEANKHLSSSRSKDHARIATHLTVYKPFNRYNRFIYASKIGGEALLGDAYFYQLPTLGGYHSLRGFRRERLRGDYSLYHNNNLHYYLSGRGRSAGRLNSFGLSAYFDHGRIWTGDDSSKWHYTYGAGAFFAPFDKAVISAGLFYSDDDDTQIRVGMGWLL